ncbi:metal ABC transporter solute-binding protein, Zn/Mn family [Amycolatopsis sp. cg5]|uniref:metal ABC transporter solute-binding protein, Zn/Mn family n=1 Tax=Amycolatopsis sp. cg5 TaxID=3238802 RepID=UPI0035268697
MTSRRARVIAAAAVSVLALATAACSGDGGASGQPADGKIKALASIDVWGAVVSAVGGDKVAVTSIIHDPSADPHSYETTPADSLAAQQSKLTIGNGGGYDDFFGNLSKQAAGDAKKLTAYEIAATGDENEHVWYSLPTVKKVADQVAAALGEVQPASKQAFADNAAAFKTKVDDLEKKVAGAGAAHPDSKIAATEPVAHYLLETAKVTDATPEEFSKAVEEEQDVPAAAVAEVKALVSDKKVKALVNNVQTVTPTTEQVVAAAKGAGVPVVDVSETLPAGVTDYIAWMSKQVDALVGALNG